MGSAAANTALNATDSQKKQIKRLKRRVTRLEEEVAQLLVRLDAAPTADTEELEPITAPA